MHELPIPDRLAEAGIAEPVGSRGDSYDYAVAEALNGTYKSKFGKLHGPSRSRAALELATNWYRHNAPAITTGELLTRAARDPVPGSPTRGVGSTAV